MRFLVLFVALLPGVALGQVKGIKLVYKDDALILQQQSNAGQLAVGKEVVASFPDMAAKPNTVVMGNVTANAAVGRPTLFKFNGTIVSVMDQVVAAHAAVFIDDYLYVATGGFGFNVLKDGETIQNISGPRMNDIMRLAATPDGSQVLALHSFAPAALTVYDRDPKTGKLTKGQVFQSDEPSMAEAKRSYARMPDRIGKIEKGAVRVPNFGMAQDLKVSPDGKFAAVACYDASVVVFSRDKQWKVADSVKDNVGGIHKYGVMMSNAVAASNDAVFVGGIKRLSWFTWDGKLHFKTFYVDDSEPPGHEFETVPYLDHVSSLAVSENGKYLFVAANDDGAFTVLKIGDDDLELVGRVNDSPDDAKMVEVAVGGGKLFAKTTKSQLLIYDLDGTFTK